MRTRAGSPMMQHWPLDPGVVFLNHGSFGAVPSMVISERRKWHERLEREPVSLLVREYEGQLRRVREALAALLGCDADDLALLTNASEGIATVVRSLRWQPNDEVLLVDHCYNAAKNAVDVELARHGGRTVLAPVPFPITNPQQVIDSILQHATAHTRLAVIDHITSPTGLVLPITEIVEQLQARGVDVLVDGAHGPGMVQLHLDTLGAAYYTGNCHKWL